MISLSIHIFKRNVFKLHEMCKKKFYLLWIVSVLGAIAVLPYATTQASIELSTTMLFGALIKAIIIYTMVAFFSIKCAEKANFQVTSYKECIIPSIISGLVVGLILNLLDHHIFKHHDNILLSNMTCPIGF